MLAFLLPSENANAQWMQMSNGMGTNQSVVCLASNGNNIFAGTWSLGVYLSTNNGTNWMQTALNNKTVNALAISGSNIIAGIDSPGGVYFSTDTGTTWTQTQWSLNGLIVFSLAVNGNSVFAGTDLGVYRSTNNGNSWDIIQGSLYAYSLVANGNNIYEGVHDYGVNLSTNNGNTWAQTTLNNQSVLALAASGNSVFAGTDLGVYLSTNNGVLWVQKNQGFINISKVFTILVANNFIFAGPQSQSVWRRNLSEILTGSQQITELVPSSFSLSQNYPNPFNPVTRIRYDLPKAGVVKLVIFDALGRTVETLVNEHQSAGTYEATFNGSQYPSGIYFYRLLTDGYSETKKMFLVK